MIYDTLFRFETKEAALAVFPVEPITAQVDDGMGNVIDLSYLPSSWDYNGLGVLPVTVEAVIPDTVTPGYWVALSGPWDDTIKDLPAFVATRNRETGVVEHSAVQPPIDIPVLISPVWAGMEASFILPKAA